MLPILQDACILLMVCLFEMLKSFMCLGLAGAAFLAVVAIGGTTAQAQPAVMAETISVSEVQGAQEAWCDALVSISKAHDQFGLAKSKPLAGGVIDAAYGYQFGPVASSQRGLKATPRSARPVRVRCRISLVVIPSIPIQVSRLVRLGRIAALG